MKKWKKVFAFAMAVVMATGLCACGKKKGVSADPALAKQNVYRMQEFDLSSLQGPNDDTYVQACLEKDGRLYLITQTYNYELVGSNTAHKLVSMNMDGGDMKLYDLESAPEGQQTYAPNIPAATEAPTPTAPDAGDGGQTDDTPDAGDGEQPDETEDTGIPDIAIEEPVIEEPEWVSVYEYIGFSYFQISDAGNIYAVKNYNYEDYSDPANYVSIQKNYVCCWDLEGKMLWETPIELQTEDSWSYVECLVGLPDGKAALMINGDKPGVITVDERGNASAVKPMGDELSGYMERRSSLIASGNGFLLTYYDENWQNIYAVSYDMSTGQLGTATRLPDSMAYGGMGGMTVSAAGDLIYTTNQGVFKLSTGAEEPVQLMNYVNSDLEMNNSMNTIVLIDDEHFVGMYTEYDEETYHSTVKGGLFTKVDPADIPDKEVLVLAGNNIPYDLRKRAIQFNKTSNTHRIILKEYSQYATFEDYYAGVTQLNNDIISGNMPDILVVEGYGSMTIDSYISKKLLADVGKLIKEDEELSKVEFMENVFDACRVDGKLYEIIPSFQVITYVGKKSLVGDRPDGWTMEEAQAALNSMPEGAKLFGEMSQTGFIYTLMEQCGSNFVDISTGKCNFNSPEFISHLEYAKTLPTDDQLYGDRDDSNWETWYKDYESQYRENRTLLANCYISNMQNMVNVINGQFGEDVSFVGFPGSMGTGGVVRTGDTFVLSARSANLDAAWEFMRYYLTDEYQDNLWQLPVIKEKIDKKAQEGAQKPYYMDENGEKVEYDYSYWMNNEEMILDPLTQQQADDIKNYISSVRRRNYSNTDVTNIISEEMDAYFKGDKSAEDVADVIQRRVQVYVNENR